jgi:hypothetical protein
MLFNDATWDEAAGGAGWQWVQERFPGYRYPQYPDCDKLAGEAAYSDAGGAGMLEALEWDAARLGGFVVSPLSFYAGVVEGTLIARNTGVGLQMRSNGLTSVTKCDIGPNNGRGVVLAAGSGGSIDHCSIHSNDGDAVWVESGLSTATVLQANAVTAPAGEKDGVTETLRGKNASLHSSGSIAVTLWSHPTVAPAAGARLNAFDT